LIWFEPLECTTHVGYNRSFTGQVRGGDWDLEAISLDEHEKLVACRRHWLEGLSWEDTGIIDRMVEEIAIRGSKDGCTNRDEVVRRYQALDEVFERVAKERRLRTRAEMDPGSYREVGGILIHVGRDNQPIFGNGGCHRLAIAQVLHLDRVPAQLGLVHETALTYWKNRYSH
jgi:hypothetical protein